MHTCIISNNSKFIGDYNMIEIKKIKEILENEHKFHKEEVTNHTELANKTASETQRKKAIKHMHKSYQTVNIAEKLGFTFCECCGRLK